jgi:glycosyltransferase involved in cell wall biosynthesis
MSDVFVFPSLFEGLPLAPIEAMLKSLPCIVTKIEPVLELFADGETGIVVAPGSVDELAAAMGMVYSDPELRKRLGAHARIKAVESFDSSTGLRAWEQLYRELAPQGSRTTKP